MTQRILIAAFLLGSVSLTACSDPESRTPPASGPADQTRPEPFEQADEAMPGDTGRATGRISSLDRDDGRVTIDHGPFEGIAMGAMTGIEKALEVTMEFVKNRKAFGQTIWDFQNTQFVLADLNARGTAARVFVNDCIANHLKGELDVPTACMAKYMVTELQGEVVDKCLQFHGGAGFINDYPIARMYRDSRITRIFGGSNEVMKMVIARSM